MSTATKRRATAAASPSLGDQPLATGPIFDEPAPLPMRKLRGDRGGGGSALCTLQGVVTRVEDVTFQGPTGSISKGRVNFVVTEVAINGAQDVIDTGLPGEIYIVPSKQIDTPEAAEGGGDKFRLKNRELVVGASTKLRKLSIASMTFYKESKDGGATGVNACAPGMNVEVSGVCANISRSRTGTEAMYLNGGKITPTMSEAPDPGTLPPHMMRLCKTPEMQRWGAFSSSIGAKGFSGVQTKSDAHMAQAKACQAMWNELRNGAADKLGLMAAGKDDDTSATFTGHEQRVRAIATPQLAAGDVSLFLRDDYDSTIAPLVQEGCTPWDKIPPAYKALRAGGALAEALPSTFVMPFTWQIGVNGALMSMEARLLYCFDKDAALEAIEKGDAEPLLATAKSGVCMSLSMRDMAFKFGTNIKEKLTFAVQQILPVADFAAFPKVSPIESSSAGDSVKSEFPEGGTIYVDMAKTLQTAGILVPEELIKVQMCEGNSQFVPDSDSLSDRFAFPDGVTDVPNFANYRYQELTATAPRRAQAALSSPTSRLFRG